jgi:hypothetical protein
MIYIVTYTGDTADDEYVESFATTDEQSSLEQLVNRLTKLLGDPNFSDHVHISAIWSHSLASQSFDQLHLQMVSTEVNGSYYSYTTHLLVRDRDGEVIDEFTFRSDALA